MIALTSAIFVIHSTNTIHSAFLKYYFYEFIKTEIILANEKPGYIGASSTLARQSKKGALQGPQGTF